MELLWKLSDSDIRKVRDFVKLNESPDVEKVIHRNINQIDRVIDKDSLLRTMLICLLSSDTDSFPEREAEKIFNKKSYLLSYGELARIRNVEASFQLIFQSSGVTKYVNKVPKFFSVNFDFLVETDWELESRLNSAIAQDLTIADERELADRVDRSFKGFGSKEARSFLLSLGVTRYEIPIDFMLIKWLGNFGFPLEFSKTALQDILFYHFVSDGIQKLCEVSGIYPCVLYACVKSGTKQKPRYKV